MSEQGAFFYRMSQFTQFESKEQFNVRIGYIKAAINPRQHKILDVMAKHSVKYVGVCGLLNKSIAHKAGVSLSAVQRLTRKLQAEGYGFKVENMRPLSGGNGANIFVFNPTNVIACVLPNDISNGTPPPTPRIAKETPTAARVEDAKTERETKSFKALENLKDFKDLKERKARELDFTYARNDIPKEFIDAVKIRDYSAKSVNFAWDKVTLAFRKSDLLDRVINLNAVLEDVDVMQDLIKRVKSAVRADKFNEIKKDFGALLYGTMKQLFEDLADEYKAEERRAANVAPIYDWTNAAAAEPEEADSSYTSVFNWSAIAN